MLKNTFQAAVILICLMLAPAVHAATSTYGWEDGVDTILGSYNDIDAFNVGSPDPVHSGSRSLKLVDQTVSGTPQAYMAWITGLVEGDTVEAGFWRYDTTAGSAPSVRIWAHYTNDLSDIDSYSASAGGNSDYGSGEGWDLAGWSWIFDSDGGSRNGLVIEARTYSSPGDTVWIDDLTVIAPDTATITTPVPLPATLWLLGSSLIALVGIKRRSDDAETL